MNASGNTLLAGAALAAISVSYGVFPVPSSDFADDFAIVYGSSVYDLYGMATRGEGSKWKSASDNVGTDQAGQPDQTVESTYWKVVATAHPNETSLTTTVSSDDLPPVIRLAGRELIENFGTLLQTEEVMEQVAQTFESYMDQYRALGIRALFLALSQTAVPSYISEPLWWHFLRALGTHRDAASNQIARNILLRELNSASGGRRSAAAVGLGGLRDGASLVALERRAKLEQNRFVTASLNAQIRMLRRYNGSSSEAAI